MTLLHQAAQKAVEALTREIMNMRGELEDDWSQAERGCYKLGHRDARHEAVALVNDAIAALESALQQQPEPVAPNEWAAEAATVMAQFIHLSAQPERDAWAQNASRAIRLLNAPALQHQEVPREPVADFDTWQQNPYTKVLMDSIKNDYMPRLDAEMLIRAAASPSTTRQQEVGSDSLAIVRKALAEVAEGYNEANCAMCKGRGFYGIPGGRCTFCDGKGRVRWRSSPAPSTPEKAGGVPVARTYLHASRVDALIAVMEGECDGLAVTRETAEAILHYLDGNAPPVGVSASVPHPLPAQANDGGEHG